MKKKHIFWLGAVVLSVGLASCTGNEAKSNETPADSTGIVPDTSTKPAPSEAANQDPLLEQTASGIDVSHFQGNVNWEEVKTTRFKFAYSKATQGMGFVDPKFAVNENGSGKVGLHHGAYHFYIAGDDPMKQAQLFIKTCKELDNNTLPPMLDLEQGGVQKAVNPKQFQQDVFTWLKEVEAALNIKPIIYTNTPFSNQYLNHPDFANYPLWLAEYGVKEPRIPNTWTQKGWFIWQRTDRAKVENSVTTFDGDTLNGPFKDLLVEENIK